MDASWKDVLAGKTRRGTALHLALQETARKWVNDGLLWADGTRFSEVPPESGDALLWLPNTLVTGTLAGEYPPIAKLRRRGDIRPLQLLINLYGVHDLGADGGILRTALRRKYRAKKLGEYGTHAIWGFSGGNSELYWGAATAFLKNAKSDSGSHPIWGVLSVLEEMGLLTVVPHLVENSSLSCEILHGYGSARVGNKAEIGLPLEPWLGELAGEAAIRLLGPEAVSEAKREGFTTLAPVWCDLPDVQMVGIYRLTYRPHTQRTTEWLARATQRSPDWQEIYSAVPWRYESWGGRAHAG